MKTALFAWLLLTYSSLIYGTTILPAPLSRLVSDADAIIVGAYRGSVTRVLASGEIVTEVNIELKKYAGLNANDLYNPKSFKVYFPGGTYNNRVVKVQSAPSFKENEHVMLFLEKRSFGYLIQNLSLGKFNYRKKGGEKEYFSSSLFPDHPELGHIELDKLRKSIQKRFNGDFVVLDKTMRGSLAPTKNVSSTTETNSRGLASELDVEEIPLKKSIVGIISILSLLIFISFAIRRKKRTN
jgi:hypothetical protein